MTSFSKGEKTKNSIIKRINKLFNEKEMLLTWDEMAIELNLSRSRITNYFPKKELLILAIYYEFEKTLKKFLENHHQNAETNSLEHLKDYYSDVMALLFEYRFSISYVLVNPMNDKELRSHINSTYSANKVRLYERVTKLCQMGILDERLLLDDHFDPFTFQHTNLLTTWVISYRLYDGSQDFSEMKPIYLKGILNCYLPYLTKKGQSQFEGLIF
ncbi:TetR/AcrR family transcriptional regulator [Winogradskyella aquimaris]|uniref:TetR/AcrR family transcriptional regulator n=1 Tax=Winogradskyella aquimaris TaxID=864074 RepID=A0ABU5EKA9_9FLAO|nr:TetR/AcrR family transcriptional regulator [Winogradskyella aquimaris]MDY2586824.1 TetR/AcrR family transcriptional regulator [Winogradskyella aquimaris]